MAKETQFGDIYLPPKGQEWNNPNTLADPKDITEYAKPFGTMQVLNEDTYNKIPVDDIGEYNHKDGEPRHPQTLYLTPKEPRHRSDSLTRTS